MAETKETIESAVHELVERYRSRCLWFYRPDFLPTSTEAQLRALHAIQKHGDRQAFVEAGRLKAWLLQHSSA